MEIKSFISKIRLKSMHTHIHTIFWHPCWVELFFILGCRFWSCKANTATQNAVWSRRVLLWVSTVIYLTERSTSKFHRFILCTVCLRANAFSHKTTSRKYNVSQRVISKTPLCLRELRCYHAVTLLAVAQQNSNKRIWSWLVYQNWTHISTTDLTLHNAPLRNYNYNFP